MPPHPWRSGSPTIRLPVRWRSGSPTIRLPVRCRPAVPRTTALASPRAARAEALLRPGRRFPLRQRRRPPRQTAAPQAPCAGYSRLPVPALRFPDAPATRPLPSGRAPDDLARVPPRGRGGGASLSWTAHGASHFFVHHALPLSRAGVPGGAFRSRGRGSPPLLCRSVVGRQASCLWPRALPPS